MRTPQSPKRVSVFCVIFVFFVLTWFQGNTGLIDELESILSTVFYKIDYVELVLILL